MDSNSDSLEMCWPKIEVDSENESPSPKREPRVVWTSESTMKLIETLENECKELWDIKHPLNKDRIARQAKLEFLANVFGTTSEEISRKIHNLRTQLNNELRKIKRRQAAAGPAGAGGGRECGPGGAGAGASGWEYFDALLFLHVPPGPPGEPLDAEDGVNLALAEFQAEEEEAFGTPSASRNQASNSPTLRLRNKPLHRVAASAPLPLAPIMWPEEPVPRLGPGANPDDCQIFGDFVASELRTLRSDESRKKLKRMIQKAILQVGEEEDVNIISE